MRSLKEEATPPWVAVQITYVGSTFKYSCLRLLNKLGNLSVFLTLACWEVFFWFCCSRQRILMLTEFQLLKQGQFRSGKETQSRRLLSHSYEFEQGSNFEDWENIVNRKVYSYLNVFSKRVAIQIIGRFLAENINRKMH